MTKRERHETAANLEKEKVFARKIEAVKGVRLFKLPDSYRFDYLMGVPREGHENKYRGLGMAELKCREIESTQFPTFMISLLKWEKGLSWLSCGLVVVFFVRYKDCDKYYRMTEDTIRACRVEWGGRTVATRDDGDIEAMMHIPIELMKELK